MTASDSSRFHAELLQAAQGELSAVISYNSLTGLKAALRYAIEIDFQPINAEAARERPSLRLFSLDLGVRSWRSLPGRNYTYPTEPAVRMVDGEAVPVSDDAAGSIHLFGQYLPVRARSIVFGELGQDGIATSLTLALELQEASGPVTELSHELVLAIGGVKVRGDVFSARWPGATEAQELARRFLDVEDYSAQVVDGILEFIPT